MDVVDDKYRYYDGQRRLWPRVTRYRYAARVRYVYGAHRCDEKMCEMYLGSLIITTRRVVRLMFDKSGVINPIIFTLL